jgi:RND family efflux transporter MFP subunit
MNPFTTTAPGVRSAARLLPLALLATTIGACGHETRTLERPTPDPVSVTVSRSSGAAGSSTVAGSIEASRLARVSTRMSGTVRAVEVDVGDRVGAGDALVRLETADLTAQLDAAEAEQRIATATYERVRALAADGAASRQELDELAARKERADAAVAEVRAQFDYAVVRAPFTGTIEMRMVDPGDLAAPGRPLLSVVADGEARVRFELPASVSAGVEVGDDLVVHRPETGWSAPATVTRIAPTLDPTTRRRPVEAEFVTPPSPAVLPGTFVRVEIGTGDASSLWIPADAIVRRGQLTGVYTVESETLRLRWVRLGRITPSAVEVLAGPGEVLTVVRNPGADLIDGAPVASMDVSEWTASPGSER